jgi:small subunit ribosomal protein S4
VSVPQLRATLTREPLRGEVSVICQEQLVVEFYSR